MEDEDRIEEDAMDIEAPEPKNNSTTIITTTASGQETGEEKRTTNVSEGIVEVGMKAADDTVQMIDSSADNNTTLENAQETKSTNESNETIQTESNENEGKDEGEKDANSSDDEGSIIDDWYDGNVLGIIDDETGPVGENGWKFKVVFLGDEEIYEVYLEPRKVRPSARGWVQRSIALLNPPTTAAGEDNNTEVEPNLPPDTSTLDDQIHLQVLKSKLIDSSNNLDGSVPPVNDTNSNTQAPFMPSYSNFRRIQTLRFQLESQIFLRTKLSKIENHAGKEQFTDGVRNPTENYVNYLVQCCKDLSQACSWYCDSWNLLLFYFGSQSASIGKTDELNGNNNENKNTMKNGEELSRKPKDLGSLTFEALIKEYLEFGKDTIVNAAMIDINASGASNKRRQAIAPEPVSQNNNRRTKRRRKTPSNVGGAEDESNEKITNLLTAASNLDIEILSKQQTTTFINVVTENIHYRHIMVLGNMLKSISHLVVDPLVSWKKQARSILRMKNEENDPYNTMIDVINTNENDEAKNSSSDSEVEESEVFFSAEQIEACLSAIRNNNVLSKFNLFDDIHKLHAKLEDIENIEVKILTLLAELASRSSLFSICEKEPYKNHSQDKIVSGLSSILHEMDSPESTLYNIDPLSSKKSLCVIPRDDIPKVIELRSWFVDIQHTQGTRERHSFIQQLLSKIEPTNTLPDPKDIRSLRLLLERNVSHREIHIQNLLQFQNKIQNYSETVDKRENDFLAGLKSVDFSNSSDLRTHLELSHSILAELKESPVIYPIEEKIAVQIDLIQWYEKAKETLGSNSDEGSNSLPFVDLEMLHNDLQTILQGLSPSRLALIAEVVPDSKIDNEVCTFLLSDLFSSCEQTINEVKTLYNSSSSWKKRTETIILSLRTHKNKNAGEEIIAQKLPAMVDIKRISDLTTEYPSLRIEIPGDFDKLQRIQSEAYEWSQNLYTTMTDENISFADALSFLQKERDRRPNGIIIFPTRTVADSTVDFLVWYEEIKRQTVNVAEFLQQVSMENDHQRLATVYSAMMILRFYPILADGSDALDIYFGTYKIPNESSGKFEPNSNECLQILDKLFRLRKTSKAPSREKVTSNDLISSLFSRMGSRESKEGFPLQLMMWVQWHLLVADFVSQDENKNGVRSLQQANKINGSNPFLSDDFDFSNATNTKILVQAKTKELVEFERLIEEAQDAEASMKKSLSTSKELFRGSLLEKTELIKDHLINLRTMASTWKTRSLGEEGLSVNGALENPLERHIKCFTWLVRTLQYPVLHEGETAFKSRSEGNDMESPKIPFNALVSIHERMPSEISEFGDHILCILRVTELYKEAKKWQDEVSRSTLISNRGNKRRGKTSENAIEEEKDAKLSMRKMEMLAEDQILSKVDMPRHKAVKAMVDAKREFETQLEYFLSQDFDGNQDNAPLPKGDSLVGRNGQFILYRLTGSSLFSMMQTSIQSLGVIGDNVFAETRGKATFDWMRSAVTWIKELVDAVEAQSKLTDNNEKLLVIPLKDATRLCKSGETIFLQTTSKDVTKTLSNHGIYVSVNSIKKRLNVRLKKDGAHHSVGGIIIRWCPILFDALRADVAKLELWENGLKKVVDDFNAFAAQTSSANASQANLFQWYCYFMDIQTALEEGQNTLVVSPKKETIDQSTKVLATIRVYLEKNCSHEVIQEFSKQKFSNSASLYTNRYELLEALLYRREIANDEEMEDVSVAAHETKPSIRDVCRSNLENALMKASWVLNLEREGFSTVEDLCALKAWEIELEMFESFQNESTNTLSDSYKGKAQSLKYVLENKSSLSLCLEVLTNEMQPNALVKMTADQVSSRFKLEREQARQAALKEKMQNLEASSLATGNVPRKPLKGVLKSQFRFSTTKKDPPTNNALPNNDTIEYDSELNADSDEEKSDRKRISSVTSSASNKRKAPPPPPPSLARQFDTHSQEDSLLGSESRIHNASGGASFQIELQGHSKYSFSALFYQEDASHASVGRFMPESLIQKGRSRIDDFDRFLSEKLKGGRWEATYLRMATASDRDASIYKSFYKDFEAKERIAMFKLHDDSLGGKLFLVTPKFHHVARRMRGISFANRNSTYAVVLTKKED